MKTYLRIGGMMLLTAIVASACTDAQWSKLTKPGTPAQVKCYSGGQIILDTKSTGAIINEQGSDGYYFRDAATGHLVETSGQCVFRYGE
jgi:hypothetical protein